MDLRRLLLGSMVVGGLLLVYSYWLVNIKNEPVQDELDSNRLKYFPVRATNETSVIPVVLELNKGVSQTKDTLIPPDRIAAYALFESCRS
eukprot:GFYU01005580.1.p2 GENE.GFYU01005580.1~~GFYU01005580.1.p2  ORF type:complete len:100 (-),score=14.00 GFYU01005580.1:908-1177(-)